MPGAIVINPLVRDDERAAFAVAANEGVRLLMEDTGYKPVNKPTGAQRKLLSRTAYKNDADAMAKTVFARIATMDGDMDPTPEQIEEVATMLEGFAELFEYGGKDWALLVRLANAVRRKAAVDSSNLMRSSVDRRLTRQAAKGGDVASLLATDELPAKVLGYAIVPVDELSEDDLAFFEANPESPGFFDPGDSADDRATASAVLGGDVSESGIGAPGGGEVPATLRTPRDDATKTKIRAALPELETDSTPGALGAIKRAIMSSENQGRLMDAVGEAGDVVGGGIQRALENSPPAVAISALIDKLPAKAVERVVLPALEGVTHGLQAVADAPAKATLAIADALGVPTAAKLGFEDAARAAVNRTGRFLSGDRNFTASPGRTITEADFTPAELDAMRKVYSMTEKKPDGSVQVASLHNPSMGSQWQYASLARDPAFNTPQTRLEAAAAKVGLPLTGARDTLVSGLGSFRMKPDAAGNIVADDTYDFKQGISEVAPLTRDTDPDAAKSKVRIKLGAAPEDTSGEQPENILAKRVAASAASRKEKRD